jgi:hypothetical protein
MSKHNYYAARDIKNEKGEVLVKAGHVAVSIESELPVDRCLAGLQTGLIVPQKDLPKEKPTAEAKGETATSTPPKKS